MGSRTLALIAALLVAAGLAASPAGAAQQVAAAGDIACAPSSSSFNGGQGIAGYCQAQHTADLIAAGRYDAVLPLGDEQYERGDLAAFLASYAPAWGRFTTLAHPVAGNHEYGTPGAAGYFDYFDGVGAASGRAGGRGEGWYSFELGHWHLIALNSNCDRVGCAAGSPQESWLRADLAANSRKCVLAYWHHPRFSSGLHGDNVALAPLWQALQDAHAEVVLSGHDHDYERFAPMGSSGARERRGVRQFVVGTGGKDLKGVTARRAGSQTAITTSFGILRLELKRRAYRWAFLAEPDGRVLDSGHRGCH